jgi:hypothetical protein
MLNVIEMNRDNKKQTSFTTDELSIVNSSNQAIHVKKLFACYKTFLDIFSPGAMFQNQNMT